MPVFRSTAITSLMLATLLALPAGAQQEKPKQCSVEEGKPSEVARAYLVISQVANAKATTPEEQKQLKSKLANGVRMLTQGNAKDNPVGHAYELGKLLVLWTMQPDVPLTVQRSTIGFTANPQGTINLPAAIDSSFQVVEKAMPECKSETIKWRSQKPWIDLVNKSIQELNAGSMDSAAAHAEMSLLFNARAPYGYMVLGQIAQHRQQTDSAIAMFQKTIVEAGTDSVYAPVRQQTELNLGNMAADAATADTNATTKAHYEQVARTAFKALAEDSTADPSFQQSAKSGLVRVSLASGDTAAARASYQPQLKNPSNFTFTDLLQAGVAASRINDDSAALQLFHSAYEANPYHRDALSNLAIYEIKAEHYDTAMTLYNRLKSVDPDGKNQRIGVLAYAGLAKQYSEMNHRIVAEFKKTKNRKLKAALTDSAAMSADSNRVYTQMAVDANMKADSMPVTVAFTEFSNIKGKVTLAGTITNNTAANKTYTMKVDFLDKSGNVVASQQQAVGPVAGKSVGRFDVSVTAPGIAAFKYAPLDND